jgi:hypothetical protein
MTISRIPSVEGGIQPTLLTAKGDLISATAASTVARLAVGSDAQILVADSSTATGLKWATPSGGGKVLQVVAGTTSTQTSSSSSTYADTTLTATITPTLATSKVLVLMSQNGVTKLSGDTYLRLKLFRGATEIAYVSNSVGENGSTATNGAATVGINYLDSPATTSATTYKTQFASGANIASFRVQDGSSLSSIVLLEIGV